MGVKGYLGYTITNITGIHHPHSVMLWGAGGVILSDEDSFLESMDSILEKASERDPYKHFLDISLKDS